MVYPYVTCSVLFQRLDIAAVNHRFATRFARPDPAAFLKTRAPEDCMATLLLNGKTVTVDAAPDTPLLWVLRDHLKLTGTKFGCGASLCGACTVHVNGEAIRSCVTPLSAVAGKRVVSIEGLQGRVGNAVQAAWDKHQVPQCGYCQSGQVMTASALLAKNAKPTDAQIVEAMQGNICRCGTYGRIEAAVRDAAVALEGKP